METTTSTAFGPRLDAAARARQSVVCVGLDPDLGHLPDEVWQGVRAGPAGTARAVERFCSGIIDAVAEHAVAIKPQLAFFEAIGPPALSALERICEHARAAGLLVVLDGKRGDIGSTSAAYASAYLSPVSEGSGPRGDALTVNPYLGDDGLEPFVQTSRANGRGLYVLVRTSNPGSAALQELALEGGGQLWERVAALVERIGRDDEAISSIGAVVGATQGHVVARARELMPHTPFLLPGIGAQGGSLAALEPAFAIGPAGGLVAASRSVLYADTGGRWQQAAGVEAARLQAESWSLARP
ncbi:MAG: orotidine-5'-phosphate decarboxylase [Gaiellales bacterium]